MPGLKKIQLVLLVFSLAYPSVLSFAEQPLVLEPEDLPKPVVEITLKPEVDNNNSTTTKNKTQDSTYCSCVKSAREFGVPIPKSTNAEDIKANSAPHVGALALFSYGEISHVAVITKIQNDGFVVREGNYKKCTQDTRFIKWQDPNLRGFAKFS